MEEILKEKSSTIEISEIQITTSVKDKNRCSKTVLSNDGLHFTSQSLRNQSKNLMNYKTQTVQITNMSDEVIASIDVNDGNAVGIVMDGYKVYVNGEMLKIENSSTNEWVSIKNYFSKLLLVDLSGLLRIYFVPSEFLTPW